jgi:hypothetical protein
MHATGPDRDLRHGLILVIASRGLEWVEPSNTEPAVVLDIASGNHEVVLEGSRGDQEVFDRLPRRGVRRVFGVDVKRSRVLEWSTELDGWRQLDASGHIEDPALEVPLTIEAILHAAKADDAIARALLARHNPVLEARLAERHDDGVREGLARGVEQGLARGVEQGLARGVAHAARALADAVSPCSRRAGSRWARPSARGSSTSASSPGWSAGWCEPRRAPKHTSCGR